MASRRGGGRADSARTDPSDAVAGETMTGIVPEGTQPCRAR
jgi:hypothetical protein